jgi:uncharacterized membrane protein YcaP (DUF421 family)
MESIYRAAVVYLFMLVIFRISGKRSLAQVTTFDFVLLLIIGEAVQQALLGQDFSITNSFLIVVTLVGMDIAISLLTIRSKRFDKLIDSVPVLLIEDGTLHEDRLQKARVELSDILAAGRSLQGIERLDQIKYAVLERSGGISIIPKEPAG